MSVLIRGMEMPKPKLTDPATVYYAYILVRANGHAVIVVDNEDGLDSTDSTEYPLVNVPPHYELIDQNALKIAVMNGDCETRVDFLKHTMDCINKAPVVIPSDMPNYEAEVGE